MGAMQVAIGEPFSAPLVGVEAAPRVEQKDEVLHTSRPRSCLRISRPNPLQRSPCPRTGGRRRQVSSVRVLLSGLMPTPIPNTIWLLWFQGWDLAPPLVQACRQSWIDHNPGWEVRAIDAEDLVGVPSIRRPDDRFPAARSDIARAHLLRDHGGVWADATVFCRAPLDSWLPSLMSADFFAFDSPGYGRMLSSWFLASRPDSAVINRWTDRTDRYWSLRDEPDTYFWFHGLFADLFESDPTFRRTWDSVPRRSAAGPHYFAPYDYRYTGPLTPRASARLSLDLDPMFKLRSRTDVEGVSADSAYTYFVEGAQRELASKRSWEVLDRVATTSYASAKKAVNGVRARVTSATH